MIGMMAGLTINKTTQGSRTDIEITDVKADLHWTYSNRSAHTDFEEIPFSQLNDDLYPGYQEVYSRYTKVITEMDDSIQVGGF
jgi:poly-gamma-glutamate synthesis protein (capsule biosynthesis protein)